MPRSALLVLCILLIHSDGLMAQANNTVQLPAPNRAGEVPLERTLAERRSIREYPDAALSLAQLGQLLWAAQGITDARGYRSAPSAGALYPLELYVAVSDVRGLAPGLYHYQPEQHRLVQTLARAPRTELAAAALSQPWVKEAPAVVIFTAVYRRTTQKYGDRGHRYVHMEVGHAAQNLFLQATALQLATVVVGAFDDETVAGVLDLPAQVRPLMLMPVGKQ